ncbi:hypothetical protein B0A52_07402 [Exophiala mesophila]|uniref:Ribosomal protein L19 n=1 Tax=Exophiala mesophila TaxID=212818 RepID=A0A438MZ95_EXOME|nr:hypothetical protein B0A52_07402 [Exophiala mesophila]
MSHTLTPRASACCRRVLFSDILPQRQFRRSLVQIQTAPVPKLDVPADLPKQFWPQLTPRLRPDFKKREIIVHAAVPSEAQKCKNPVALIDSQQLSQLDPTGARSRLFDTTNKECVKVGDILLTTFKSGEPFSGVVLAIKGSGPHTSVLLRNQLTKIGTEMLIKVHSPLVQSMEVAWRVPKRKRKARLYYMRRPDHDMGSVQKVVDQYLRQRALLTGTKRTSQFADRSKKGKRR